MKSKGVYAVLALLFLSLGYEFWALGTHNQLLSEAVWEMIAGRPFVPFLAGFLCGHFFWQEKRSEAQ